MPLLCMARFAPNARTRFAGGYSPRGWCDYPRKISIAGPRILNAGQGGNEPRECVMTRQACSFIRLAHICIGQLERLPQKR